MLSTLHQFLNQNSAVDAPDYGQESKRHEVVARLYFLLVKLTDEQKFTLLKLLVRDRIADFLFKRIVDLSDNQQLILMKQLEQIAAKPSGYDRRKHIRKDCLINAKISVGNRILTCFILDISPHGAYIDTDDGIAAGQSSKLMFSLPSSRKRLIFSGQVVRTENQGAGIKLNHSDPQQLEILRGFTDDKLKVYEINSC